MHPFRTVIFLTIGTLILAILLRGWLVIGLIAPVTVSGSSMAPGFRGDFVSARCAECEKTVDVGAEYAVSGASVDCPHCDAATIALADLPCHRGDRLWIDRTAIAQRQPRRWEVVVLRSPHDARDLCVKRIVGLPGETVELADGDVWINGQVAAKPLAEQRALRLPLLSNDRPVTDNLPYNVGLSRSLHLVRDFSLSAKLRMAGPGSVTLEIDDGRLTHRVTLAQPEGRVTLYENGAPRREFQLSALSRQRLGEGQVEVDFSNFDRQLLLALSGKVELREPIQDARPPAGVSRPLLVEVRGPNTRLSDLEMYRDTYYTPQAVGTQPSPGFAVPPDSDAYFLLGDNSPISLDSRSWGPVPAKLLMGKPLLAR